MPPRPLTPGLVTCRCRPPPPPRVVASSADYECLMFLGARRSCGESDLIQSDLVCLFKVRSGQDELVTWDLLPP